MANRGWDLVLLLILAGVVLAPATLAQVEGEAPAIQPQQLYEQVNALVLIRGLGLNTDQLQRLLALQEGLHQQRQAYRQQAARLWQQSGSALQQALQAGPAAPAQVNRAAQQALNDYAQSQAALQQALDYAVVQLAGILTPAQQLLVESRQQAEQRRATEALLGGTATIQEYMAQQMEVVRALPPPEYRLLRYWQAQRLAALLRPPGAPGYDYLTGRVLLMMDSIVTWYQPQYAAVQENLPELIAEYLGLPTEVRTQYFEYDQVQMLLDHSQAQNVVEQLLGQVPSPVAPEEASVSHAMEKLASAVTRWQILGLLRDLQLTGGQLRAIQPLVQQAARQAESAEPGQQALIAGARASLKRIRDLLLAGTSLPPDLAASWGELRQSLKQEQQRAAAESASPLARIADFLTIDQAALVSWPPVLSGEAEDQEEELTRLRQVAAEMARGYDFFEHLRYQRMHIYIKVRIARIRELIAEYLPPDSPQAEQAEDFALDIVERMKLTPEDRWERQWPWLLTELMVGLGAVPAPQGRRADDRPISWSRFSGLLSDAQAATVIGERLQGG